MNRAAVLEHLAHTERHIRDGERHLLRQREIVAELECHGHGHSTAARLARDLLELFEGRNPRISMTGRVSCSHCKRQNKIANGEPPLPSTLDRPATTRLLCRARSRRTGALKQSPAAPGCSRAMEVLAFGRGG